MFKHNLTPVLNKQRPDKDGRYPLRIRATVKGKVSYYPTGVMLMENQWDKVSKRVVDHPMKIMLNAEISNTLSALEKQFIEHNLAGNEVLRLDKSRTKDFYQFAYSTIERMKVRDSPGTYKQKKSAIDKFRAFKGKLNIDQITPALMHQYEQHCHNLGNSTNTIWKSIKFVMQFVRLAAKDAGRKYPLEDYRKPKYTNPERQYLTEDEIDRLEKLVEHKDIDNGLRSVTNWFLFSCYCGLRYGDAAAFDRSKIVEGKIVLRTGKKGVDVAIPIHPRLSKTLDRIDRSMTTMQDYNRMLKVVAVAAKIKKPLTSHIARHTFAVQFLNRGGSMEVLSKLLGHNSMRATAIYGKITNTRIDAEVLKVWGYKKAPVSTGAIQNNPKSKK